MLDRRSLLTAAAALAALPARAAEWPDRPVRLLNTGAPGSGIDLVARVLGEGLARHYRQPFPVENRPTGGMIPAGEAHATARAGESLLVAATGIASTLPFTAPARLPFDPLADLVPVAILASEFLGVAVPAASPAQTLPALLDRARAQPGALNWYCVPGYMELNFRLFLREQGMDAQHVSYRGSPPAVLDLVAGRLDFAIVPLTPALSAWQEGKLRMLAVTNTMRAPRMPEVPTAMQAGVPALGYDPYTALFGWRGMAAAQQAALAGAATETMRGAEARERLGQAGLLTQGGSPAALAEVIAAQRARMEQAIRVIGRPEAG